MSKLKDFFWKNDNIFPKTQEKFSKLKEKTQNSRKKLNIREDLSSPTLPSDVPPNYPKKKNNNKNTLDHKESWDNPLTEDPSTPQPNGSNVFGRCHGSNPHGDLV